MTQNEFEELERAIESEKFLETCSDPITYGIAKAAFDEQKYRKLLAAAQRSETKPEWSKLEIWTNQLASAHRSQARLEQLRNELRPQLGFMAQPCRGSAPAFQPSPTAECGSD